MLFLAQSMKNIAMANGTEAALRAQWSNPSDVSTILMVIGGDVVQMALAQGTGVSYFTPVCFSFGCVSYAFTALVKIIGNGRLLPEPDYPVKLFNLDSGHFRDNKNWVVGRIFRDLEISLDREEPLVNCGLRIAVYEATVNRNGPTHFSLSRMHLWGFACILAQLSLATIPIARAHEWDVMLITAAGTLLVQLAGCLPQWRAEKLPNRQASKATYALTQGNGAREVVIIQGNAHCLDLEELSAAQSPRNLRIWGKFDDKKHNRGFWLTRAAVVAQSLLWLLLLVNVASTRHYNWVLLAIGTLGMFQNAVLAGMASAPHLRNLPLRRVDVIRANKIMDGLMDYEVRYPGRAEPLRDEFFPGRLRKAEIEWWAGNREPYDRERVAAGWRGTPPMYQSKAQQDCTVTTSSLPTSATASSSGEKEEQTLGH